MTSAFTRGIAAAAFAGALALSAAVPALAQYYPGNGGYYGGNYNNGDRQITGTVQSFGGFNMTLATNNTGNRNWNNNRRDRDEDGDRDDNGRGHGHGNGNNGNNNGRWNNNGGYNNGGYNNNGRWNNNGGYNNGGYNGGYYNNGGMPIHLHQGTIINPAGTTLQPGMNVRIWGHPNSDGSFEADRIDVVGNNGYRGY